MLRLLVLLLCCESVTMLCRNPVDCARACGAAFLKPSCACIAGMGSRFYRRAFGTRRALRLAACRVHLGSSRNLIVGNVLLESSSPSVVRANAH